MSPQTETKASVGEVQRCESNYWMPEEARDRR
jgi:hypothetical protein